MTSSDEYGRGDLDCRHSLQWFHPRCVHEPVALDGAEVLLGFNRLEAVEEDRAGSQALHSPHLEQFVMNNSKQF